MMKKAMFSAVLLLLFLCGCSAKEKEPISATDFKLNTVITVTLYDSADKSLLDGCMEICDRYELIFSRTNPRSELYLLNEKLRNSPGSYPVSEELAALIQTGLDYAALSKGRFDITVEPVSSLWDFTSGEALLPDAKSLERAAALVGYQNISVEDSFVVSQKSGIGIDLGAIAKGYIADRIKEYLIENGVKSAIIDLGGNLLCIGAKPDNSSFQVGIQKPFAKQKESIMTLSAIDCSIVSSGSYERYFVKDDILYHHILNPRTGYPYENGLASVTILSNHSVQGDALSTVCFSLGLKDGLELVNRLEGVKAIFITDDGSLYYSDNLKK